MRSDVIVHWFFHLAILTVSAIVNNMVTTYVLNTKELESSFIDSVRTTYPDQVVEIQVRQQDETEYLLSTLANRERMERILKEAEEGKIITFESLEQAMQAVK
jgi:hypothetical protein